MTVTGIDLQAVVAAAFEAREAPVAALAADATGLALTCRAIAERLDSGGRLLAFGNGAAATDAQHVAVEFVHPAIVGKRALPAVSLVGDAPTLTGLAARRGLDRVFADQIEVLGRPADVAVGLSRDGNCPDVRAGLSAARRAGMLTVALLGGAGGEVLTGGEADHCLVVPSDDPLVVKEGHVTVYHLLWELVHVFLDARAACAPGAVPTPPTPDLGTPGLGTPDLGQLYPFLYAAPDDGAALLAAAAESARQKVVEVVALRREVGAAQGAALAACAEQLAGAFSRGATLLAFGNGGSSTDAQDVVHSFVDAPPDALALPALGLTNDAAVLTALSNDVGFDVVFARQVHAFGRAGDIALALSTSGGSSNVLAGLEAADHAGLLTVGLAGYGGGRMAELPALQHLFTVPSSSVHRVQEVQTTTYHVLWEATQAALRHRATAPPHPAPPPQPPARG
ncbi:MAG: gmhA [Frankiales bacterium]|nr:gmhA [Frankiales bacterium]